MKVSEFRRLVSSLPEAQRSFAIEELRKVGSGLTNRASFGEEDTINTSHPVVQQVLDWAAKEAMLRQQRSLMSAAQNIYPQPDAYSRVATDDLVLRQVAHDREKLESTAHPEKPVHPMRERLERSDELHEEIIGTVGRLRRLNAGVKNNTINFNISIATDTGQVFNSTNHRGKASGPAAVGVKEAMMDVAMGVAINVLMAHIIDCTESITALGCYEPTAALAQLIEQHKDGTLDLGTLPGASELLIPVHRQE